MKRLLEKKGTLENWLLVEQDEYGLIRITKRKSIIGDKDTIWLSANEIKEIAKELV